MSVTNLSQSLQAKSTTSSASGKSNWLVVVLLSTFFLSFLSPQISYWGRGLKLSLPVFLVLTFVIMIKRQRRVSILLKKQFKYIGIGLLFVTFGFIRYLSDPQSTLLNNFVISCLIIVIGWIAILFLKAQDCRTVENVRWITLIILGICLGSSIPLLFSQPGVARLTMGNPLELTYIAIYYPKGIANYILYTAIAISWSSIANWQTNQKRTVFLKLTGWASLLAMTIAVFLSTFTMAIILLTVNIFFWIISLMISRHMKYSSLGFIALLLLIFIFPRVYSFGSSTAATEFSTNKATRIITTTLDEGILAGDETGRAQRLIDTFPTILRHPFFGAWGLDKNFYIGGHSSWGDFWALFGIFGLALWLYFLSPLLFHRKKPFSIANGHAGGTISWILFCVGGIINPTFNFASILLLIWIFDMRKLSKDPEEFTSQVFSIKNNSSTILKKHNA